MPLCGHFMTMNNFLTPVLYSCQLFVKEGQYDCGACTLYMGMRRMKTSGRILSSISNVTSWWLTWIKFVSSSLVRTYSGMRNSIQNNENKQGNLYIGNKSKGINALLLIHNFYSSCKLINKWYSYCKQFTLLLFQYCTGCCVELFVCTVCQ